ncbi:MAG TPA: hypothetical protein VNA11_07650 [Pseudonocardia sp.]|jgi:hypothetical protein|nr:hypothetical protein [Pseudonocardia sp.]
MQTTTSTLNNRDRAVLRAVAAGRCEIPAGSGGALVVDGLSLSDQFAGLRLTTAGLISAVAGRARLTASGQAVLAAA